MDNLSVADLIRLSASAIGHLMLALLAVVLAGRALGVVCRHLGQPEVVGQVLGGIVLGPSLLGALWPAAHAFLLPAAIDRWLGVVSELGIVLYMFLVGLELDARALRGQLRATVVIALGSILVPFALGAGFAAFLPETLTPDAVSPTAFVLFFGVACAIVAFPVLARILAESGLSRTDLGVRAIGAAAVSDLVVWCLLAIVVGTVSAAEGLAWRVAIGAVVFLAFLAAMRPWVVRAVRAADHAAPSGQAVALTLLGLLATASMASWIGIHAVIGAFLFGALIPHDSRLSAVLANTLEKPVTALLLPAFFAFIGMNTEIGLVSGLAGWAITLAIVAVATVGKIGGTYLFARLVGRPHREAMMLGVLMNTRGLMELVVLEIGLTLGVITPPLFAMMVVMALATTMMTMPLVEVVRERSNTDPS